MVAARFRENVNGEGRGEMSGMDKKGDHEIIIRRIIRITFRSSFVFNLFVNFDIQKGRRVVAH